MGVWRYGVWVYGGVNVWGYGYVEVWIHWCRYGGMNIISNGCMEVWVYGSMGLLWLCLQSLIVGDFALENPFSWDIVS